MQETLPPEIKQLMEEAVSNQVRLYHQSKRDALREHTAEASRKKILWSSAFSEGELRIYLNEFEKCAQRVLDSIKSIHFTPFPNCEKELIAISTVALHQLIAREPSGFSEISKKFAIPVYQSRAKHALKHLETELKIHVNQLRSKILAVPTPQVTVVGDNNNIQTGDRNTIRAPTSEPRKKFDWVAVIAMIAGVIVAILAVLDCVHRKPKEPSEQSNEPSSNKSEKGSTFSTIVPAQGSSNPPDYIEETEVTYGQLKEFFPFGFTVFYLDNSGRLTHDVYKGDYLKWDIDWDKVDIKPDFSGGKVLWSLPIPSAHGGGIGLGHGESPQGKTNVEVSWNWHEIRDFKKGFSQMRLPWTGNEPVIFSGVLSDNQLNPVFVIGFRMRTPNTVQEMHGIFGDSFEFIQNGDFPNEPMGPLLVTNNSGSNLVWYPRE